MDPIEAKLIEMGHVLPAPPTPGGLYLPFRRHENLLFLSGVICVKDGEMTHTGQLGAEHTLESGYEAAQVCALNALAAIKLALGDLDAVGQFLYVGGYVNAVSGFAKSPQVINGASELFNTLYGERGQHARAAVAVAGLPVNSTVEIQVNVAVR